ncbi:hypothetical protein BRE01_46310 [Brevibacillus reuszeri]|uniref:Uncharacterized protein n=1 Tax=Brevibacillus reuszeri TaxID=54915 RepID=A0ABQ0TTJ8_9BACL|nr:hypothetical protein [Brevibacillus reuszeri]MED1861536.1 hypothetical protein [Brevibacillus reuszeri]GED70929.1 hypothetical protein BRE01_46310 [Brevibacillus reuszeri]
MIYIQFEKETETRALVTFIHYNPLDPSEGLGKTADELSVTGILIESLPQAERKEGKDAKLYFNPQTKEAWYEYVDHPRPEADRITQVEIATEENKKANLDTQEAVLQLYEMVTGPLT